MCSSENLGCRFIKSSNVGRHFSRIFRDVAQIFSKSKHLGVSLHLCALTSIIGNIEVDQIDLKHSHCSFSSTQKIQNDFL